MMNSKNYLSVASLTVSAAVAVLILKLLHAFGVELNGSSAEVQGAMTVVIHWLFKLAGVNDKIEEVRDQIGGDGSVPLSDATKP